MIYLTLLVSELPVVSTLGKDQKIYMRLEQNVPDEFITLSADDVKDYFASVREVMLEDLKEKAAKSTPQLASEDGGPPSG